MKNHSLFSLILLCFLILMWSCSQKEDINTQSDKSIDEILKLDTLAIKSLQSGKLKEAEKYANELINISKKNNFLKGVALGYRDLGYFEFYSVEDDTIKYVNARKYFKQSYEIAQNFDDEKTLQIQTLTRIANCYEVLGSIKKTIEYLELALGIAEQHDNPKSRTDVYNSLGVLYSNTGKLDLAIKYLISAINELASAPNDVYKERMHSQVVNNLGKLLIARKDYQQAEKYYLQSIKIKKETGFTVGLLISYLGLGKSLSGQEKYIEALKYYYSVFRQSQEDNKYLEEYAIAATNIAGIHTNLNQLDSASFYYRIAIDNANRPDIIANNQTNLGIILYKQNKLIQAKIALEKAISLGNSLQENDLVANSYDWLSKVYHQQSNHKKAYEALDNFSSLRDSIYKKETIATIDSLNITYQTQIKEDSIQKLQLQQSLDKITIRKQQNENNAKTVIIILALLIIGLFIYFFRKIRNQNLIITNKNERLKEKNEKIEQQKEDLTELLNFYNSQKEQEITLGKGKDRKTININDIVLARVRTPDLYIFLKDKSFIKINSRKKPLDRLLAELVYMAHFDFSKANKNFIVNLNHVDIKPYTHTYTKDEENKKVGEKPVYEVHFPFIANAPSNDISAFIDDVDSTKTTLKGGIHDIFEKEYLRFIRFKELKSNTSSK